ncbi:MAG: hypothetical protein NZO16_01685 [Deltaproteobacteria bacterium]|nr:hypothetical protein [Deltaproteobacteria bacterium]
MLNFEPNHAPDVSNTLEPALRLEEANLQHAFIWTVEMLSLIHVPNWLPWNRYVTSIPQSLQNWLKSLLRHSVQAYDPDSEIAYKLSRQLYLLVFGQTARKLSLESNLEQAVTRCSMKLHELLAAHRRLSQLNVPCIANENWIQFQIGPDIGTGRGHFKLYVDVPYDRLGGFLNALVEHNSLEGNPISHIKHVNPHFLSATAKYLDNLARIDSSGRNPPSQTTDLLAEAYCKLERADKVVLYLSGDDFDSLFKAREVLGRISRIDESFLDDSRLCFPPLAFPLFRKTESGVREFRRVGLAYDSGNNKQLSAGIKAMENFTYNVIGFLRQSMYGKKVSEFKPDLIVLSDGTVFGREEFIRYLRDSVRVREGLDLPSWCPLAFTIRTTYQDSSRFRRHMQSTEFLRAVGLL